MGGSSVLGWVGAGETGGEKQRRETLSRGDGRGRVGRGEETRAPPFLARLVKAWFGHLCCPKRGGQLACSPYILTVLNRDYNGGCKPETP